MGEIDALAMADDGRVFYAGRAVCFQGQQQFTQWTHPQTGLGCGPIYVWDPRGAGAFEQNPNRVTKVADFTVLGAKGGGNETGLTAKTEHGILGLALDPGFTSGRPYVYVVYHPYYGGTMGRNSGTMMGPGFVRADYMGERRVSRFTYNETTKTLSDERIIHRYMTQVFSCCHLGGSMDWDSQGNLYFATGDNTGNAPNSNNGGYTNAHPQYTVPCPGDVDVATYEGTGCGVDTSDPDGDGPLPARQPCPATQVTPRATQGSFNACGYIGYSDARQTSGNSNTFEGKLLRVKPVNNPPATAPRSRALTRRPAWAAAASGTATTRTGSRTTRRTTTASIGSRRRARPTSGTARRAVATTSRATPTTSRSTRARTPRRSPRATAAARGCSVAARRR
jgi:hypothetical protein